MFGPNVSEKERFIMFIRLMKAVVAAVALCLASVAGAQEILTHMRIAGLDGDSTHRDHRGDILLTGYTQTIGTRNCSRVVVTKFIDRASAGLITRAATNLMTPQVQIDMQRSGEGTYPFFFVTLDQVTIERIELAEQNEQLVERVVMAPRSIRIEYKRIADDGVSSSVVSTFACSV
jgi:type VI protein secretion system component Hcp